MSYKQELQENNTELEAILQAVNELPEGNNSGNAFALPQIRYANFISYDDAETGLKTYRFTVENLGCGTLKVGDRLQICCRRKYAGGKFKLRKMIEHIITEDELNHRFLKIEVIAEQNEQWLFRNDRKTSPTLSAMYFRLKRATAYDDEGKEVNAIFSNVEQVWKTYDKMTLKLSIK